VGKSESKENTDGQRLESKKLGETGHWVQDLYISPKGRRKKREKTVKEPGVRISPDRSLVLSSKGDQGKKAIIGK